MNMTCENCIHAMQHDGDKRMKLCRRYPPHVLLVPTVNQSIHPVTKQLETQQALVPQSVPPIVPNDWTCGEFSPAPGVG